MRYADYGFTPGEEKKLKFMCQQRDFPEKHLLLSCAEEVNAPATHISIVS